MKAGTRLLYWAVHKSLYSIRINGYGIRDETRTVSESFFFSLANSIQTLGILLRVFCFETRETSLENVVGNCFTISLFCAPPISSDEHRNIKRVDFLLYANSIECGNNNNNLRNWYRYPPPIVRRLAISVYY